MCKKFWKTLTGGVFVAIVENVKLMNAEMCSLDCKKIKEPTITQRGEAGSRMSDMICVFFVD